MLLRLRFRSFVTAAFSLLLGFSWFAPIADAADFVVSTRDEVLTLTSQIQAIQFLNHATFGPTQSDVASLSLRMREIGTQAAANEWITNQMALPASLQSPREKSMIETDMSYWTYYNRTGTAGNYTYTANSTLVGNTTLAMSRTAPRTRAWWHNSIAGPDQLRQKTAWALSQIFSVANNGVNFNEEEYESEVTNGPQPRRSRFQGLTNYYDIFLQNAFGNYRTILGRVTYHPIMGDWLSFRGNRRFQNGVYPDENYAREVMQLFTIGLYLLNDDGTQVFSGTEAVPTYDAVDIREYAQIFTGLGYGYGTLLTTSTAYSPYAGTISADPNSSVKFQVPMRMAPAQHDRSAKWLLNGVTLPSTNGLINNPGDPNDPDGTDAGMNNSTAHTEASANNEIDIALSGLFNHQSCPPFIAHRLIQRFVKSNPSRAYLSRVVAKFKNNGSGVRGDMAEVVRAILTDQEAWQPIRVQYLRAPINKFVVTTMGSEDSRLQEPVVNYTRFIRFFRSATNPVEYQRGVNGSFTNPVVLTNEYRLGSRDTEFDQTPYEAPSVFNFYLADFRPTGEFQDFSVSTRIPTGVLVAPEFNIVTAITSNNTSNFYRSLIVNGNRQETIQTIGSISGQTVTGTNSVNTANQLTLATESTRVRVNFDFTAEQNLIFGTGGNTTSADIDRLLERLDLYLCGGTLSSGYKASLKTHIQAEVTRLVPPLSTTEALNVAKGAILSVVTAPSFLVTE